MERINLSEAIKSLVDYIKEKEKVVNNAICTVLHIEINNYQDDGLRFRPKPNPFGENGICVAL